MSTLNVDKVDPSTGTALEIGTSGDTITVPSGATFVVAGTTEITGTNNVQRPNAQPLIINGDMQVAQRGTSSTGVTATGYRTVDRWLASIGGTGAGTWTSAQEALTSGAAYTDGFSTALRWDCTTADASLGASDVLSLQYRFEGQDLQLFKKGTANAETYTVAFWVKSNKTGTSQCNLYDGDNNRLCGASFTISSGDTWEHKICNFAADTTGVLDDDNAESMLIYFPLAAGSNYTGGAIPTAWETLSNSDLAASNLALADSTSNDFAITGIQLEVGTYTSSTIPPFQHESYGDNLRRCERYFQQFPVASGPAYTIVGTGFAYSATNVSIWIPLRTPMRATPSFATTSGWSIFYSATAQAFTPSFASDHSGPSDLLVQDTGVSSLTAGDTMTLRQNADASARLKCDSEL